MGKLSSIEDVEARDGAAAAAADATPSQPQPQSQSRGERATQAPEATARKASGRPRAQQPPRLETAADEEDFHGLSSGESLGAGHGALVAIAVVAVIVVAAYFVNYWFHIL